jgi:hypothetical protein
LIEGKYSDPPPPIPFGENEAGCEKPAKHTKDKKNVIMRFISLGFGVKEFTTGILILCIKTINDQLGCLFSNGSVVIF